MRIRKPHTISQQNEKKNFHLSKNHIEIILQTIVARWRRLNIATKPLLVEVWRSWRQKKRKRKKKKKKKARGGTTCEVCVQVSEMENDNIEEGMTRSTRKAIPL
ncbi:hypothetical protein Y032_0086g1930 [Ancylostoma ceylanicum]|uniref:Uncharacterized protein n=1 Tax=Ancylostoma ceylanicum TaxID=53326 RepID=A0A016TPI5_9BILA|nr:hypothetical protein Y032_0086g1930 [Ancylostoma ceylanicum]